MDRRSFLRTLSIGLASLGGCGRLARDERPPSAVATDTAPQTATETPTDTERTSTAADESAAVRIETVTMNLEVPWGAAFHPESESLYLTERPGRIRRVTPRNGPAELVGGNPELVADFTDEIVEEGEGGLLGLAFHPDDPDIAFTYGTYESHDGELENRIVRHDVAGDFEMDAVIFDAIPAASVHNGGRLAVGPGGALYATTGDADSRGRAQDVDSLAGKVLRLTPDGDPHPENPSNSAVFSYGHCNPQGLAFHPETGAIFATEHGSDHDEINVLQAGKNYGWPQVIGESGGQFTDPITTYSPTIAPASATFYDGPIEEWEGRLFFGTLAGQHLRRVTLDSDGRSVLDQHQLLVEEYGRLRTVFTGPKDHLYVTTSNQDGRGHPAPTDDRVLRIMPA